MSSIKEYYIFAISTSENCGGVNQSQLMYFWRSRGNWSLEVMGVDALKIRNAQDNTWSNIPEEKYLFVSWAEPPLAVFKLLSKQSHARSVTFVVILTLISFKQSIYQISCFSLMWLSFENRLVICDRPECGSAFKKKLQEDVLLSWHVPLAGGDRDGYKGQQVWLGSSLFLSGRNRLGRSWFDLARITTVKCISKCFPILYYLIQNIIM